MVLRIVVVACFIALLFFIQKHDDGSFPGELIINHFVVYRQDFPGY